VSVQTTICALFHGCTIRRILITAGKTKLDAESEQLTDMRSRVESMLALREKGVDALFSLLDSTLPPLVASGTEPRRPLHESVCSTSWSMTLLSIRDM
jgi:hypothetical protein